MKRLTHERANGIKNGYWSPEKKEVLVQRLAEYENTGLEPEEIKQLNDFEKSQVGIMLKKLNEEQRKHRWIPVEEQLPEDNRYILLSFANFSLPMVGRYEINEDGGGAFYLGDCDEEDTCVSQGLYVNAWMPLPGPYRPGKE